MKVKSQRDFWSGLMFSMAGLGFAWGALNYSFGDSSRPGPGYFPFGLGMLLALMGALVLFKALAVESDDGDPIGRVSWQPLLLILSAVLLFGALLPRLGLFVALPLLVIVSARAGDDFRWKEVLISAAVLTVLSWLGFVKGLGLALPLLPVALGIGR